MDKEYARRLSVSHSEIFDLNQSALWSIISTPGILEKCHPFCKTNAVQAWNDNEHTDSLVYLNGRTYIRRFQTWSEGRGYTLLIGVEGGSQSYVEWQIEAHEKDTCRLTITVYPFILARFPSVIAMIPHALWVRPRLRTYLKSVLLGFRYHAENHRDVPRNHFGRHPWFS